MIISSCTVNQQGQNMLQLQVSISCPVKRQAIGNPREWSAWTEEELAAF
jgi:hypothetical protein